MELWTAEQAAEHWGVTPARARGILSSRHIARVSGYRANDVRAVRRRQGARTDRTPPLSALSLTDTAEAIRGRSDDRTRLRIFFEFTRGADEARAAALSLITDEPPFTGDIRYDALLAAAAEHVCARYGVAAPLWTTAADRFLTSAWWVSPLPSARTYALVFTPAAFRRHGIYLDRHDLTHDGAFFKPEPLFDATELLEAFAALAAKLERRRVVGHVHVFGGAAMLLAYHPDRVATRDIDAQFAPDGPMLAAIREVAREKHWPTTWLNNQAVGYASRTPGEGPRIFDHPHLQVVATPPDHLLAMKALAARATRDAEDIQVLLERLNIARRDQVWAIVNRFFPDTPIPDRSRALIDDLLDG